MSMMFEDSIRERLVHVGVVAVLVIDRADQAVPLAKALLDGGIDAMELTLRTPAALEALHLISKTVPEMLAGMGTILTPEQVQQAHECGAQFGVAPGCNRRVMQAAIDRRLSFAPGIVTPSEIEQALELGCRLLKFFPAEPAGGLTYLRAMAAPYAHLGIQYIPLGGLGPENLAKYLQDPLIAAVGGSWIAPREAIARGDWPAITETARAAAALVDSLPRR